MTPTLYLSKSFHFDASHYLPGHDKCGELHGHTWYVFVDVGISLPKSIKLAEGSMPFYTDTYEESLSLDLHEFGEVVRSRLALLDHKCLNDICPFIPTCENLAFYLAKEIQKSFMGRIDSIYVSIQEGEGGSASISL